MKRHLARTAENRFLGVWLPRPLVALIKGAIGDSDRSQFIRAALREWIAKKQTKKVGSHRELVKS